jgi:hypothetical protein
MEKVPYDAECDATRIGMERFFRALLAVRGHFSDSFSLAPIDTPSRVTIFLRVWLRPGTEARFVELAKIREPLKTPPRVSV